MKKQTVLVNYLGIDIEVEGVYSPEEPMVIYYKDGSGYPGSASEFEVIGAFINGQDAVNIMDRLDAWNELAELAIEKIEE